MVIGVVSWELSLPECRSLKEKRLGLSSMVERVNLLEGRMRINSRPSEGTRIFIEVPLQGKKDV